MLGEDINMVWSKTSPKTGKPWYIRREGDFVVLTKDKRNALDNVPSGWEVFTHSSGELKLRRKR